MYIYMNTDTHTRTRTRTQARTHTYTRAHTRTHTHTHIKFYKYLTNKLATIRYSRYVQVKFNRVILELKNCKNFVY